MTNETPDNRTRPPLPEGWASDRLRAAIEKSGKPGARPGGAISEEELAAFALGELPPVHTEAVLELLSTSPDAAELVAQMYEFRELVPQSYPLTSPDPVVQFGPGVKNRKSLGPPRWLLGSLAAAACVVLTLSAWMTLGPAVGVGAGDVPFGSMGTGSGEPDYWRQLTESEQTAELQERRIWNLFLFASIVCTCVLALVVCILSLRRPKVVLVSTCGQQLAGHEESIPQPERNP